MDRFVAILLTIFCAGCAEQQVKQEDRQVTFAKGSIHILKTTQSLQPLLARRLTDKEIKMLDSGQYSLANITIDASPFIDDLEILEYNDRLNLKVLRVLNTKKITDISICELKEPEFLYLENTPNITAQGILKAYPVRIYLRNMSHITDRDVMIFRDRGIKVIDARG